MYLKQNNLGCHIGHWFRITGFIAEHKFIIFRSKIIWTRFKQQ